MGAAFRRCRMPCTGYTQAVEFSRTKEEFVEKPGLIDAPFYFILALRQQVDVIVLEGVDLWRLHPNNSHFIRRVYLVQYIQHACGMSPRLVNKSLRQKRGARSQDRQNVGIQPASRKDIQGRLFGLWLD